VPAGAYVSVSSDENEYNSDMKLRYNYRLYPSPGQCQVMARAFGCARVVFNDGLHARQQAHAAGEPYITDAGLSARLTAAKAAPERAWLGEVSAVILQQSLADLNVAYRQFFESRKAVREWKAAGRKGPKPKEAGLPRFKSRKDTRQAIRFTANARFRVLPNGNLRLPKIGDVPVRWSRPLPSGPSSVTVILDAAGRYFASFVVEVGHDPLPASGSEVGIDLGLTHFAVLSDGRKVANPRFLRRAERKLRKVQQALSRKAKGSSNRAKARVKVARVHARVADTRRDWLHKESTRVIRDSQAVYVEDLCWARPDPAGQVRARRGLVGIHRDAGVQGPQARAHVRQDRAVRADFSGLLGVREQGRPKTAQRPRVDLRGVRHGARPGRERGP
jgi:putative transposase